MRRYASSKFRLVILMAVLIAAGFLVQQGMAQSTAPASECDSAPMPPASVASRTLERGLGAARSLAIRPRTT